jgi:hypothetical protein
MEELFVRIEHLMGKERTQPGKTAGAVVLGKYYLKEDPSLEIITLKGVGYRFVAG